MSLQPLDIVFFFFSITLTLQADLHVISGGTVYKKSCWRKYQPSIQYLIYDPLYLTY